MLIVAQLPMADVRPFLSPQPHHLKHPDWGNLAKTDESCGYVHRFGEVKDRRDGGNSADALWSEANFFCNARRAVAFPENLSSHEFKAGNDTTAHGFRGSTRYGSRRYYGTPPDVRVEIGMARQPRDDNQHLSPLAGRGLKQFIDSVLDLPLVPNPSTKKTRQGKSGNPAYAMHAIGVPLAKHVLESTTHRGPSNTPDQLQSWWVAAGLPMLIVEYRDGEIAQDPDIGHQISVPEDETVELRFWKPPRRSGGRARGAVWLIHRTRSNAENARKLRMNLMCVHARLQCVRRMLDLLHDRRLDPKSGTPQNNALKKYLDETTTRLRCEKSYGIRQEWILRAAVTATIEEFPGARIVMDDCQKELDRLTLAMQKHHYPDFLP